MRSPALLTFMVAVMLLPASGSDAHPRPEQPEAGPRPNASVSGTVRVIAPPQTPPPPLSPYARRRAHPPQEPGIAQGSTDAFVYLESLDGRAGSAPDSAARIEQHDRMIMPYSTAVRAGQTVEFPNDDDVFHNLFSLSPGNRFSLGRYAPGVSPTHTFDEPGVVRLFCDIHAEMAGMVLVVDTPWVVRVGDDSGYTLPSVPPGEYRAVAWHPTAGADTTRLVLDTGARVEANFMLALAR